MNRENAAMGERVQARRVAMEMTQGETAKQARIDVSFLSQIERGVKAPGIKVARRLAQALEITIDELFYGSKR